MPVSRSKSKKRSVTPEDLTRLVFVGGMQISPDGEQIVFVHKKHAEKNEMATNLWRVNTSGGDPEPFTSAGKDSYCRWSPDGSLVGFIRYIDGKVPQIFTIPRNGGEATQLTRFPEGTLGGFSWSPDGKQIAAAFRETDPDWTREAVEHRKKNGLHDPPRVLDDPWYRLDGDGYFNGQRFKLYVIDTATGAHRKIFSKDHLGFYSWDWSPDSKKLAVAANPDKKALQRATKTGIYIVDAKTGKDKRLNLSTGPKDQVAWSPNGKQIAYAGREGDEDSYSTKNMELWVCNANGTGAKCISGKDDYCLMAVALTDTVDAEFSPQLMWQKDSKSLLVLLGWHGESHVASIPAKGGRFKFLTRGACLHGVGNLSRDGKELAMFRTESTKPTEIFCGRVKASEIETKALTSFNKALLQELDVVPAKSHWIKAADGHKVQLWSMMPTKKGKVPGVMEIHGGPHAQYGMGFFHEFQMLVSAGYAVFFSNPRGSKGYGQAHTDAISGDWGSVDWVDIQAVAKFMREHPRVNAKKMGIMGGSYGGYMTNWAIGHTNEFAGAITDRCVSNLVSMGGNSDFPITPDMYWEGNFWDRPETLWSQSPIKYMGNCKTPTLIIHSEGDLRCNIEQSEEVFALLTLKNVPTRFVRYPRTTSHGMSRGGPMDMRLHRLNQILEWWKKYLK